MTNAIAIYDQFDNLQRAATALQASGYFADVKSQAQAIVKVMAGAELGLPPFASMTGIHIIQGKPALGANVIATLVKNDPRYDYRVITCTNDACTIAWFEAGQKVGESSFTMQEANAAGLTGKDNWRKFAAYWHKEAQLNNAKLCEILEVSSLLEYDGNFDDANQAVLEWLEEHAPVPA